MTNFFMDKKMKGYVNKTCMIPKNINKGYIILIDN